MNRSQACELASRYLGEAKRPSALEPMWPRHFNLYLAYEAAFTEAARAMALDPNDPDAYVAMAWVMVPTGKPQAGLEFMRSAMRLNPPIRAITPSPAAWPYSLLARSLKPSAYSRRR